MYKSLILSILFFTTLTHAASQSAREGIYVYDSEKLFLSKFLANKELSADLVSDYGYEIYGPEGLSEYAYLIGAEHIFLPQNGEEGYWDTYYEGYPTNDDDEYRYFLLGQKYPEILTISSLGTTSIGTNIPVLKISDNSNKDEKEPEFLYVANMHGNEVVGRRVLIKYIEELLKSYKQGDQEVVKLINNNELFFIPTLNPDGYENHRRGNKQWTDLNRDFPDFSTNDNINSGEGRALETIAMMEFSSKRHISLSGSFHDGAVVVNYPWDTVKELAPLDDMIQELSLSYARHNEDIISSSQFKNGITNGYAWYHVDGGIQDWAYYFHDNLMITLELSNTKWPKIEEIDHQYNINKDSIWNFMKNISQGSGFITPSTSDTGEVTIRSIDGKTIGNFSYLNSEFYKILPTGDYIFTVEAKGGKRWKFTTTVTKNNTVNNGNYIYLK